MQGCDLLRDNPARAEMREAREVVHRRGGNLKHTAFVQGREDAGLWWD
jgi:tRNA C32,U32 (ribose-2'-O)-methylase TrmJ